MKHDLYQTGDADTPDELKDSNGAVVIYNCRRCGAAEWQLDQPCSLSPSKMVEIHHFLKNHLTLKVKQSVSGFPADGDATTSYHISLVLKNPETGEEEELGSDYIET
jgi:hypothetical protein